MPVDPQTVAAAFEAGKGLAAVAKGQLSVTGWENKSRPLVLFFNNMSSTKVKVHNWVHCSGKALRSISSQPFSNSYAGEAFLCEGDNTFLTGVSGTFQVTVGNSSKFVFLKIHFRNTPKASHPLPPP